MPAASPLVKVLIAEPDPIAARILRLQLTRAGLAVTLAEDGPDAAACLRRERFDVLMMDLHPFGMTGDALLQTARAECDAGLQILLCAERGHEMAVAVLIVRHGIDALLAKPCSPLEIVEKILSLAGKTAPTSAAM